MSENVSNKIKKIHALANCYWGNGMSGGDRRFIEIVRRWKDKNADIVVYTTEAFKKIMINEGITFPDYVVTDENCGDNEKIISAYRKRTINCFKELGKRIKKGDSIYSSTDILPDVYPAYKIKKKYNEKIKWTTITYHIYEDFYKRPGNIITNFISCQQQKLAISYGKRWADVYLTTSPLVFEYFKKNRFDFNQIKMVDNAVDTDLVEKSNIDANGYDAVFLARLNHSKGILELPEIWAKVMKRFPEAKLGIIGKGSQEIIKEMDSIISETGTGENVELLGYLDSEKAYSIIKKSKIFLFTSHEEGWGMAIAEAMVCGIPVVAYNLPIFSYLFKEGIKLCELKNVDKMSEAVCEYLADESTRIEDGQKARKYVLDNYSLDSVAEKELELII